jgi:tetratricopeptide (TPR) repeat protein
LAELASFSLAKFEEGGERFRIHRLVQDVTRERQIGEERDQSLRSMLEIFNKAECGAPQDVRSWPVWDPLRPHLFAATTYAEYYGIADPTTSLMSQLAVLLLAKASYADAEPLMKRALAIDEASYGPDHPDVARDLNNLAMLLQSTNRLTESEPLMRRALAIDEASYGANHPNVARDLNNFAHLLQDMNRLEEAEPLMRRALAIDEAGYGPNHPDVARDLSNLATLLQSTNRLTESEPLMRRALAIDEASYGPDHPTVAICLNNLAVLLKNTSRLEDAEPLTRRQLVIFLKVTRSTEHPHPHLKQAGENYLALLQAMGLSEEEISRRLLSLGEDAGFDAGTYRPLLAELLR